jgi:hypothetical protein
MQLLDKKLKKNAKVFNDDEMTKDAVRSLELSEQALRLAMPPEKGKAAKYNRALAKVNAALEIMKAL